MCDSHPTVAGALAMLDHALDALNAVDAGSLPAAAQAEALRALERAEAKHTAARARMLGCFSGQGGYEHDGQGNARTWLRWQAKVTRGAAAGSIGWARRLAAHPVVADALAAGEISASWARQICDWSDQLPGDRRGDSDEILVAAACGGARESDLANLAREMFERSRQDRPDSDGTGSGTDSPGPGGAGSDDRGVWLGITLGGAGRLDGDLTPGCAAALAAVLDSLGKKAGPEDARTAAQRRHDALEEAARRLVAAGLLPARAGQPTQIQVHLSLAQLRRLPGGAEAEAAWIAARADQPGWLSGPDASAAACDAAITSTVTGHVDAAALDRFVQTFLTLHGLRGDSATLDSGGEDRATAAHPAAHPAGPVGVGPAGDRPRAGARERHGSERHGQPAPLSAETLARLRATLLRPPADVLSGPAGLASHLRRSLLAEDGAGEAPSAAILAGPSLPLDIPLDITGAEPAIPAHLRRAVAIRHPRCAFPGCDQPASVCQVHHLIPRSEGGPTALANLVNLCAFHHLVAVHRWGWKLALHPDGATIATSPDGRTVHSHGPPAQAA